LPAFPFSFPFFFQFRSFPLFFSRCRKEKEKSVFRTPEFFFFFFPPPFSLRSSSLFSPPPLHARKKEEGSIASFFFFFPSEALLQCKLLTFFPPFYRRREEENRSLGPGLGPFFFFFPLFFSSFPPSPIRHRKEGGRIGATQISIVFFGMTCQCCLFLHLFSRSPPFSFAFPPTLSFFLPDQRLRRKE